MDRRVDGGHPLEIDVGLRDVVYVVGHAAQDRVDNRLLCVAAYHLVAMELLDPFEVDDWYDTDQEIGVLGDIDRLGDDCSVQPLVEEHVRV